MDAIVLDENLPVVIAPIAIPEVHRDKLCQAQELLSRVRQKVGVFTLSLLPTCHSLFYFNIFVVVVLMKRV